MTPSTRPPARRRPQPPRRTAATPVIAARARRSRSSRLRGLQVMILFGAAVLVVQLVNLTVLRSSHFEQLSAQQLVKHLSVPALRASIYDRNGQTLALSIPTNMVVVDDQFVRDPASEAVALSPLLSKPVPWLEHKLVQLAPNRRVKDGYVVLSTQVNDTVAATLQNDHLDGITVQPSSVRTDPDGSLALSILGGDYATGSGAAGLEYQYQSLLAGQNGDELVSESPYGVTLPSAHTAVLHRPVPGTGIELTIDAPLQFVTEQALGTELIDAHATTGTAIVMDTQTGQILSMASLVNATQHYAALPTPAYWPTSTGIPGIFESQNNLAVTQTYEPGSVFKVVPFSAALLSGEITPTTRFAVPDQVIIDGHVFHDAEQHGLLHYTATQILEYSSNIGTYEISRQLGEAGLLAGVERLGFGQPTGLDFPGESNGLLMSASGFSPTDVAALPIGQEDSVTPLQVLDAYNTIADGGRFISPSLVRARVGIDGSVVPAPAPVERRALPLGVARTLTQMLVQVVSGGTGTQAGVSGYTIAGKTGTAQIPNPYRAAYLTGAYNATFVGFAPAQHPVLTMIVVIQRPTPVIYGGYVAAPVFARVMGYALHRYGVPSSRNSLAPVLSGGSVSFLQDVT